ncbi:myosin heavy chain, embryonic smooth muscle isoform-like [Branchiostoma lanceolatum]|uniref:myosin heavy chain, embryonic smooth muscle isoform-like n=1 Tax=Branchiostoma lanceolatum TaxID=7740 RepID=UPI0034533923
MQDKDAKIKKLEADVQTMRDQLASSKESYSGKERELKAVPDQLEEEKATSANLRHEMKQSGEEQTNMLLELEGFREKGGGTEEEQKRKDNSGYDTEDWENDDVAQAQELEKKIARLEDNDKLKDHVSLQQSKQIFKYNTLSRRVPGIFTQYLRNVSNVHRRNND